MKKLILVRHGDYEEESVERNLTELGENQIAQLSEKLKTEIGEGKPLIFSSMTTRVVQSAQIIAKKFGVQFEQFPALYGTERFNELLALLRQHDDSGIVMTITHGDVCREFPRYFFKEELNIVLPKKYEFIHRFAEACIIDLETKSMKLIKRTD